MLARHALRRAVVVMAIATGLVVGSLAAPAAAARTWSIGPSANHAPPSARFATAMVSSGR